MNKLWKVCGMREEQNIRDVLSLHPDFMGFIFYEKSKRYAGRKSPDELLISEWPTLTQKVGVFVNTSLDSLLFLAQKYRLDYIQLHGEEDVKYCSQVVSGGYKLIKAFSVDSSFDFSVTEDFEPYADYFLFDTKAPEGYGGHGVPFDWSLLEKYQGAKPFLLAGGIDEQNVKELSNYRLPQFAGIDVNSRFEDYPAFKNLDRLVKLKSEIELF
jgi:phosphoribosylanthranilate isomerase